MGKKRHRRKIERLEEIIHEHEEKIRVERGKDEPDEGLIAHWEKEISAFQDGITKTRKRLARNK